MTPIDQPAPVLLAALSPFELGTWTGQSQAFRSLARHCSAADAECLKRIRESRSYEGLGLTWEEFCPRYIGISRTYADKLIHRLEEFGQSYFQLAGIARIAPDAYRILAPAVTEAGIEIDGETIAIIPENAGRIRKAVEAIRTDLRRARELAPDPSVSQLVSRFDGWIDELAVLIRRPDAGTQAAAKGLTNYAITKLKDLSGSFVRR